MGNFDATTELAGLGAPLHLRQDRVAPVLLQPSIGMMDVLRARSLLVDVPYQSSLTLETLTVEV